MPSGGPSYGSYCCVSWCFNNGRTHKKPGTSFFRIPRDGRMKAWMQYAGRDDLLSKPASLLYATYRVCSDHFTAQSFMDPGHTRLTRMAVPSVQPDAPCSLSVASNSDCDMTAEPALQGPAIEASKSGSHTLRCPDEQGGSSLVAGERISADFVLPEKTLTSRSAVTKGTCVTGRSQDCSDSTVRGPAQASQDPPEDVSANSSTPKCPGENDMSTINSEAMSTSMLESEPYIAEKGVLLRRCPCGQVVNTNDASQLLGWKVRRDVSIQCDLQEMAPLPLPREVFPSAAHVESIRKGTSCNQTGSLPSEFENGMDHGAGNAVGCQQLFQCHRCQYSTLKLHRLTYHLQSHSAETFLI
ncbi:uncharacterized protein LOC119163107 isoform X1 [Rhipicephalus microplus]|uniref:uncharacterized protein LOC119163107 isoform X1 n=1 Tax=Rhipicephalus microplus TaxID=6941 RepID=UPI003F6CCB05